MSENQKKDGKINKKLKIVLTVISLALVGGLIGGSQYYIPKLQDAQTELVSIPLDKLNQGYDIVCNIESSNERCVYNQTAKTMINPDFKISLGDLKTNKTKNVDLYQIQVVNRTNSCLKEFDVNLKNQTTGCTFGRGFPIGDWYITKGINGQENLFDIRNYTQ